MAKWQIHRFRDVIDLAAGDGATVYLAIEEARHMERALRAATDSVERERFAAAPSLTVRGECIDPEGENRRVPRALRNDAGRFAGYVDE